MDHDSNLYATYRQEEARLRDEHDDLEIRRVVLEQDLKREYQEFLQEHNRDRSDSDGRPDRDEDEIRDWAREHDLPYFDDQVHFPDYRIEYEVDGRERHRTSSCSRSTTAAPMPPATRRPASASTSSPRAVAAAVPRRIRAGWRSSCDARILRARVYDSVTREPRAAPCARSASLNGSVSSS